MDPEGQTLEDAAALTFLDWDFAEFSAKTDEDKMVDILRKTWEKMSGPGRGEAGKLKLGEREKGLLERALQL